MQAGTLRHRVTIEKPIESRDATGAMRQLWQPVADVWASIEPVTGREFFSAAQVQSTISTKVRIRFRVGITEKMRVKHIANRTPEIVNYYDIAAVIPVFEKRREMVLMCTRWNAEGIRGQ